MEVQSVILRIFAHQKLHAALVSVALTMVACTSVPIREFTSYRQVFADARAAGEQVLFDYSAAVKEYDLARKQLAGEPAESRASLTAENDLPPDAGSPPAEGNAADLADVAVRIRAWDVVQRYNDFLLDLAEGKSAAQVSAAVNGLMQSLATFPLEDIAAAAGSLSPYIGVLKEVLALAEYERSRRVFVAAVKEGAPIIGVPISETTQPENQETFRPFLNLLRDDAKTFYNVRKGLNDLAYDRIVDSAADLRRQYRTLISAYKPNAELKELTTAVNEQLKLLDLPAIDPGGSGQEQATEAYTPIVYSQLSQLKEQIGARVEAARKKTGELAAYKAMVAAYVKLIDQMAESLQVLLTAVERNLKTTPPLRQLLPVYIELRQAIHIYRDSRGS